MDINKKVLLRIFELDDEIVDDLDLEVNFNQNKLYIKFKKIIKCCSNCGSVNFLSKGFYKTCLIGCPFNGKPTLIVCKLRKYVCKDCHSYFVENNPIVYKNSNLTRTAVITILDELKPYTATYSQVGRRFGISTTQVINLFDKYVRVKKNSFLESFLLMNSFSQEKLNLNIQLYS